MGIEIERKFIPYVKNTQNGPVLLDQNGALVEYLNNPVKITQGYLQKDSKSSVRVRIHEYNNHSTAHLTIKSSPALKRKEFEFAIGADEALRLLTMCDGVIKKNRYVSYYAERLDHRWDIDQFPGKHRGLWLAEFEYAPKFEPDSFTFSVPWLKKEVTKDKSFYNANIAFMTPSKFRRLLEKTRA
jgi:CYTH domain-containing protein